MSDMSKSDPQTAGERIAHRRREIPRYRRDQAQLAEDVGVARGTVSAWENDQFLPEGENLRRLAECLEVTQGWILEGAAFVVRERPAQPYMPASGGGGNLARTMIALSEHPQVLAWKLGGVMEVRLAIWEAEEEMKSRGLWTEADDELWSAYSQGLTSADAARDAARNAAKIAEERLRRARASQAREG